jgi:RND family efflux transporter MFP subunit
MFVSPVDGKIATLPITIGQLVNNGTKVASIVDDSRMIIRTGIGPSLIRRVKKGETVCLTTKFGTGACSGVVTAIGAKPGNDNFNYPIEIEVANNLDLLSGQLVSGKVKVNSYEDVIAVNPSSVKDFYGKKYVYVVDSASKVQKRIIEVEDEVSERVIVKSGLKVGDNIVIQGFEFVKENQKVSTKNIADVKVSSSNVKQGE